MLNRLSRGQAQIIDGIGCFKEFLAFQNEGLGPGFASGNFSVSVQLSFWLLTASVFGEQFEVIGTGRQLCASLAVHLGPWEAALTLAQDQGAPASK